MKRPLCVIVGWIAVAVFLLLQILPVKEESLPDDRAVITIVGKICEKERKISSFTREEQLVVYLKMDDGWKVMLYPEDSGYKLPLGCTVRVRGKVRNFSESRNPGEFDSREYYRILKTKYSLTEAQILGIGGNEDRLGELLFETKMYFEGVLDETLEAKDAGVMKAVLLGDKSGIDEDVKESFKRNGIIHIMAVSGLHISIIGMTLYKLIRKSGAGIIPAAAAASLVMYAYGVMCGMSTSAYRAIVMFIIHLGADIIGRTYDMLSALALSGIMLLCSQPLYLKHSGFLMSFGAVLALGYILPAMPYVIRKGKLKLFSASISIMLVTLPVSMCFYYTYPVYSMLLNVFILPLMSLLMILGIFCIGFGALLVPAGILLGKGCHLIIWWFIFCCDAGNLLPGNTWYVGCARTWQIVIYFILLGIFVIFNSRELLSFLRERGLGKEKVKRISRIRYIFPLIGIFILCIRIRPELRITALDVGQGDGIVIETKTANYLIDGGSTSKKNIAKYQLVPFLAYSGIGKLDAVIMTHEDEDHISGIIELMDEMEKSRGSIEIRNLLLPKVSPDSKGENYQKLEKKALENGIKISYVGRGDSIWNRDMEICCIGPKKDMLTDEPNSYSTVLYLKCNSFSALFTGDVDGEGQEELRRYIKDNRQSFDNLTLLKVAHHGSRYTTDKEFLELLHPKVAFISCGINNRYNHPHKEVLDRLEEIGAKTYITAENGAISAFLDGNVMKIKTYID